VGYAEALIRSTYCTFLEPLFFKGELMGHENKTVKRYRRKMMKLQDENTYLNRLVDVQNMKIDLLSNKLEKAIEKVEKMPDEYFGDVELSEEDIEFMNAGLGPEKETDNG
jgi:predicted RNase H-like nuclease (RuvC/YqgF family)